VTLCLLGAVCAYIGNFALLDRIVMLGGAIAGFCAMNMRNPWQPRARAFLGNSGSTIIGLALTWLAVRISHTIGHPVSSILIPWLVAPPLIDCVVLMLRRARQRRSPFAADRNHMHHLLLDAGFRPGAVALTMIGLTAFLGASALIALRLHTPQIAMVLVFLFLIAAYYVFSGNRARAVAQIARWRVALARTVRVETQPGASTQAQEPVPSTNVTSPQRPL
jgi:UDP-GlcNAc:undecaprenyl-phosphate GlcNAc-1-phosphate transferase